MLYISSLNDSTSVIKLTAWGTNTSDVPDNRIYYFNRLAVREWSKGVLNLTTRARTKIDKSQNEIAGSKSVLPSMRTDKVKFCPLSLVSLELKCSCPQCVKVVDKNEGCLFRCPHYNSAALFFSLVEKYTIKMKFGYKNASKTMTLYHKLFDIYLKENKARIPQLWIRGLKNASAWYFD